jgi:hypothetical protein
VNEIEGVCLARKPRDSMNLPGAPSRPDLCTSRWPARVSSGGHSDESQIEHTHIRADANGATGQCSIIECASS